MVSNILTTPLSFKPVNQSFLDSKQGLGIELGYFVGLPAMMKPCERFFNALGLAIVDKGHDKKLLDQVCVKMIETLEIEKVDFMVTKSTYDFDQRWFWLGDFKRVFALAEKKRIALPISDYMFDTILDSLRSFEGSKA